MNTEKEVSTARHRKHSNAYSNGTYTRSIFESAQSNEILPVRYPKNVKLGMSIDGYTIISVNPHNTIGIKMSAYNKHCDRCKTIYKDKPLRSCKGCAEHNLYKRCFSIGDLIEKGIEPFCEDEELAIKLRKKDKDIIKEKEIEVKKPKGTIMGQKW